MTAKLTTLPNSATVDDVLEVLERDGGVIVADMIPDETMDRIWSELSPYLEATPNGDGDFVGHLTRRTSSLLAKSPACAALVTEPHLLGAADSLLRETAKSWVGDEHSHYRGTVQVSAGQAIYIGPGQKAQPLHRDDMVHHRRHPGPESQVQTLYAGTEYHYANGATMVIPGSHLWDDDRKPLPSEAVPAEMTRGSGLIHLGSTYHGGGANTTTDEYRLAISLSLCRGYLRQEENQYLAVPREQVLAYPEEVQRLLGYGLSIPFCGWYEMQDPHLLLRDGEADGTRSAHDLLPNR
ncbi:phytanoyl-CoA dioxygenase family protein [Streptomyces sp. SID8352]|uniref:phytanoyl-CoA dioxygenase family protein n=1 Tax=Streptomyces sp. SID8352 TaxID=2690338 RepID=UPI00136B04D8|nr:phytanoyl-CoA dioxygenase family protein [Streptomyces sp. SID8352]MYU22610.1 phytanoyl-CoA dioxygenase family protein [Streptomyces sp. SID8352]